jgi:triosephosphate isomerase
MTNLIICNWKMNLGGCDALGFLDQITITDRQANTFVICPPFTSLPFVAEKLQNLKTSCAIGAQDCAEVGNGSRTGDISAEMLKSFGCTYVIVGHSERRQYHKETSITVKNKALKVIEQKMTPIICVGETEGDYKQGNTQRVLKKQLAESVPSKQCVIAYEPVWAIGTGKIPKTEEIQQTHQFIEEALSDLGFSNIPIVYGGSVKADNISQILLQPSVSGVLIGGASIKVDSMNAIIKELSI